MNHGSGNDSAEQRMLDGASFSSMVTIVVDTDIFLQLDFVLGKFLIVVVNKPVEKFIFEVGKFSYLGGNSTLKFVELFTPSHPKFRDGTWFFVLII